MYVHTIYLNKTIIVSIIQQNLDCNLHENGVIFLWIIVSIVQQTSWKKATFKYSDSLGRVSHDVNSWYFYLKLG